MCHTCGLARSPAELQGGQGQGHQGVPLQVKKHSLFLRFSSVISTCLAMLNVCLNGLRGDHAHGHRDPGDGQPQQGHVPHHDKGVQHSLTFQLAKNVYLYLFIGSVLDWQNEHKLRHRQCVYNISIKHSPAQVIQELLLLKMLTACNAVPPAKSKMAARGPQNGRRGLERCLFLDFWAF